MSIKRNALANYLGTFFLTIVNLLVVPFYIQYLGRETYGLVGFFAMLQGWLNLLDLGMAPTLAREVAKQRANATTIEQLRTLVRSLEWVFFSIAFLVLVSFGLGSEWVVSSWLKTEALPKDIAFQCVLLMSLTIPARWVFSLYRSGINGMEKQVWLNTFNIIFAAIKAFGSLLVLAFVSNSPIAFFGFQTFLILVEGCFLVVFFYKNLPMKGAEFRFSFSALKKVFPFAGSVALTSSIWLLISKADKLILSHRLSLSEYGFFTLAITAATSVSLVTGPISNALLPRLTFLVAQQKDKEMVNLYRTATQFITVFTCAITGLFAIYARPLLLAWVGDSEVAEAASPILFWYILGDGILSIMAFQYYLQYAYGKMEYHVKFNVLFAFIWIPALLFVANRYGAIATGKLWFFCQLIFFVFWTWFIHNKFVPGLHKKWLLEDVLPIMLSTVVTVFALKSEFNDLNDMTRFSIFFHLTAFGVFLVLINALVSKACRSQMIIYFSQRVKA